MVREGEGDADTEEEQEEEEEEEDEDGFDVVVDELVSEVVAPVHPSFNAAPAGAVVSKEGGAARWGYRKYESGG